ncbi:hypothetical protein [Synechococcus sp. BA-132 BA5]|uniref:hypothetical protein n=1 Tax=Synechococcus sp. BA-132 BA5 TaxID=3110252 RepID=UPI002B2015C5|nr:hypothetical protein [Synechococcus sp. BA-132 BA5]MEA5413702.1 hypothetical protein [Synechococcus sp. BA-132 BA5]
MRSNRLMVTTMALAMAGSLSITACSSQKEAARQAADQLANTATATGQAALAPAVTPVIDLLRKGESEVKGGNIMAAVATMGGFKALWAKAAPVIQPLAGDKWSAINGAANTVLSTFDKGATPDAAAAGSAITGLIGPLSALIGQ